MILMLALGAVSTSPVAADYQDLLCQYPWDCARAERIMLCESGGRAWEVNNGNYGLLQINQVHSVRVNGNLQALLDPETNIAIAYQLYQESGWQPWRICSQR